MTPTDVLTFWFRDWDDALALLPNDANLRRWSGEDGALAPDTSVLRQRFEALHDEAAAGACDKWAATPDGSLALVLVLDQFSRLLFRNTIAAFRNDLKARTITLAALERAQDREMTPIQRAFLYTPLMHAEDRTTQRRALALFTDLAAEMEEASLPRADHYRSIVSRVAKNKAVIDRFGRYPQRNIPLERTSTPEELEFMVNELRVWRR